MNVDDENMRDEEDVPTSILFDTNGDHQTPILPPVILNQLPASTLEEYKQKEEDICGDSTSTSSSASTQSLELNPNSDLDRLDIPGIALLKEIFPEETTDTLRKLHHKHIMFQKASSSPTLPLVYPEGVSSSVPEIQSIETDTSVRNVRELYENDQENNGEMRQQNSAIHHKNIHIGLPDDNFLRLPKSVAILRQKQGAKIQTYEFIQDLENRALEEYHLAATTSSPNQQMLPKQNSSEYKTYVVEKDSRWGLGMTLQEVEDEGYLLRHQQHHPVPRASFVLGHEHTVIRYGLMVIGFLSDTNKMEDGENDDTFSQSPAESAGIQFGDVVIGINGNAFLLQVPLSSSSTLNRRSDQYKIQKERIIHLIQKSPSPVVLHIRRRRNKSSEPMVANTPATESIKKIFSERNFSSLLDTTSTSALHPDSVDGKPIEAENFVVPISSDLQPPPIPQSTTSLKATLSPFPQFTSPSPLHPLSVELVRRKLIRPGEDQRRITRRLQQFTDRARQCESSNSLRILLSGKSGGGKGCLVPHFDPNDLPREMVTLVSFPQEGVTKSAEGFQLQADHMQSNVGEKNLISHQHEIEKSNNQHAEQENLHIQSLSNVEITACTPSTPALPFDSPLIPIEYLQAFYGYSKAQEIRSKSNFLTRSALENEISPRRLFWQQHSGQVFSEAQHIQSAEINSEDMAWIPLHGIRKALSARIVNSFVESSSSKDSSMKSRIAYTIWVYDLESGREWYAPIRYWEDFSDLREAAMTLLPKSSSLYKELSILNFAKDPAIPNDSNSGWSVSVFGSPSFSSPMSPSQQRRRKRRNDEFDEIRQQASQSLEEFLRELLGIIYTCDPLDPSSAEIALYVQSFLGVDAGLKDGIEPFHDRERLSNQSERKKDETEQLLKRSIQRYSWRIFLLHTLKAIVKDFVDAARARGPKLNEIESMDPEVKSSLKTRAMDELLQIQRFLDQLVDLILDGCSEDLRSIAKRQEYSAIHKYLEDESYWDRLARESVREQVEIEVYVPLRSTVSRLLVNGWRHEDMEVHFKIKELRKRPQGMFRIDKTSPSHWQSVATILKQGVGMSTLPCVKLRAIVDAAREISQLHQREHDERNILGADEFLPIFIFCVVRAEMERPCALSILLQTLCDRINRIGEIGYFLASFEASIAHIKDIDLTEDKEDMLSFLTVPLTEVSLND